MSGRDENQLFIGRLPRGSRASELEDVFYKYGKMTRCDVKQGERQIVRPPFFLLLTHLVPPYFPCRNKDG